MSVSAVDALDHTRASTAEARIAALIVEGEQARQSGQWRRALTAQHAALELTSAVLGRDSVTTAIVAQNLAVTYKYVGGFDAAEALLTEALAVAEAAGQRQVVATICHNLGGLAHARGAYEDGVVWARRAVEVRESLNDPLALAGDRGALAGLLIELGQIDEAHVLLGAARSTFVDLLGNDDLEVAIVDGNLAAIALRRGELAEAEHLVRAALATKEAALGAESPALASNLTTLGVILRRRGAVHEAAQLHRRALKVLRPHVEEDHPLLRTIQGNLDRTQQ